MFLRNLSITQRRRPPYPRGLGFVTTTRVEFHQGCMAPEERCSLDIGEMLAWMGMDGVGIWMWSCRCLVTCCRCDVFDCQDVYERFLFGDFLCVGRLAGWRHVEWGEWRRVSLRAEIRAVKPRHIWVFWAVMAVGRCCHLAACARWWWNQIFGPLPTDAYVLNDVYLNHWKFWIHFSHPLLVYYMILWYMFNPIFDIIFYLDPSSPSTTSTWYEMWFLSFRRKVPTSAPGKTHFNLSPLLKHID